MGNWALWFNSDFCIYFTGFLYDREWVLIDNEGRYLNQKKVISLIPLIDKLLVSQTLPYITDN